MTNNRYPALHRDISAPKNNKSLHEYYVRAINGALEAGREDEAYELANAYAEDLSAAPASRAEAMAV